MYTVGTTGFVTQKPSVPIISPKPLSLTSQLSLLRASTHSLLLKDIAKVFVFTKQHVVPWDLRSYPLAPLQI